MPLITRISEQKQNPGRRTIYLDGRFAFACRIDLAARFKLREGMELSAAQVEAIKTGEIRQECLDEAMALLSRRLHSRSELSRKLMRKEYDAEIVNDVLDQLSQMNYVNDERFARTRALSAAQHKQHGRRRAMAELLKTGIKGDVASKALDEVYGQTDSISLARELALKQAPRLRKLDPVVARRRLVGMLQRR